MNHRLTVARTGFVLAAASLVIGAGCAARAYPAGFDWPYQVMSSLASLQRNPQGARWFSVALVIAMLLLLPLPRELQRRVHPSRTRTTFATRALQTGLAFGVLMGLERSVLFDASSLLFKSHEMLALACFVGLYVGSFALCIGALRSAVAPRPPIVLLFGTLTAAGLVQLMLWWSQRHFGWVNRDWRALGIPVWQSFAFWQWFAAGTLLFGLGYFAFEPIRSQHT